MSFLIILIPMVVSLLTHICVTRPQWIKSPTIEGCTDANFVVTDGGCRWCLQCWHHSNSLFSVVEELWWMLTLSLSAALELVIKTKYTKPRAMITKLASSKLSHFSGWGRKRWEMMFLPTTWNRHFVYNYLRKFGSSLMNTVCVRLQHYSP